MTATILPSQWLARDFRKTVITSGQPLGFETGFRRNSPSWTCRSCCEGMMKTWSGWTSSLSVMSSTGIDVWAGRISWSVVATFRTWLTMTTAAPMSPGSFSSNRM